MNAIEQKRHLQAIIENKLSPLISNNYVLWDLPYHINIGDTLIWQGTLDFLKNKPYKMLDFSSSTTAVLGNLSSDTTILLSGGGNFGDIYDSSQNFRKNVIKTYKNNKIIILPQTIHFNDLSNEQTDFKLFSEHNNLYLCVRDQKSYDTAIKYLNYEQVLFLPDMAFCIDENTLPKIYNTNNRLLMKRIDTEAIKIKDKYILESNIQSDWPTFEKPPLYCNYLRILSAIHRRLPSSNRKTTLAKYIDHFAMNYARKKLIETGINFINNCDVIYTTRLHGCILSLLLDKEIILLDNSYGKNKAFHDAWLKDSDNIKVESC